MDLTLLSDLKTSDPDQPGHVVEVLGRKLYARTIRVEEHSSPPPFVCISYVWGTGRLQNPMFSKVQMSTATLPCLAAALLQYPQDTGMSFWIDAFCIPSAHPHKAVTLSSMGLIYALCRMTLACLSPDIGNVLQHMSDTKSLDENALVILARDPWIRSVWTYQEVANTSGLRFVAQVSRHGESAMLSATPGATPAVDGTDFLNWLGGTLVKGRAHLSDTMPMALASLDAFEDLLLDWMTADYRRRSLLQILSNFPGRIASEPQNIFYSIIGCLLHKAQRQSFGQTIEELATTLLGVCEEVGDFSYIYTANQRQPGSWKPKPEILKAILNWHVYGIGQEGRYTEGRLWLCDMVVLEPILRLETTARAALLRMLSIFGHAQSAQSDQLPDEQLLQIVHGILERMGFIGSMSPLLLQCGVFYPQEPMNSYAALQVLISTGLRWTFGRPGLLRAKSSLGNVFCAGVFVGSVKEDEARDVCLSEA